MGGADAVGGEPDDVATFAQRAVARRRERLEAADDFVGDAGDVGVGGYGRGPS